MIVIFQWYCILTDNENIDGMLTLYKNILPPFLNKYRCREFFSLQNKCRF